jgi:hypothetical protein
MLRPSSAGVDPSEGVSAIARDAETEGGPIVRALKSVRPSPATVIASIALLVALAGTGYAATSLPANSVGNVQLQDNAVTSSKVKDHGLLKVDFANNQLPRGARGSRGARGPVGPTGSQGSAGLNGTRGPTGPAGAAASSLWAVVNADGSLARGSGVITVVHTADTGIYEVQFNRVITQCAWPATIRGATFGFIETELFPSTTNAVRVETTDEGATLADRSFHLVAIC